MHRSSDAVIPSAFRLSLVSFATNGTLLICCKSDTARIPSRPYKLFSAMRRRVIWMLTIVPVSSRGVAAVLDLLAADGDAVDDPAPIYELLAERCRHVRVALEVMTGCE